MKYDIIKIDNYLLVVDESEIKIGDWYYLPRTNEGYKCQEDPTELELEKRFGVRKIIAHLPLNDSPILEGVDLLPPLSLEEDVEKLALKHFHCWDVEQIENLGMTKAFNRWVDGYNKAKEKYKYTEEDMYMLATFVLRVERATPKNVADKFIQSLSQPKMPIGFEFEASKSRPVFNGEPKTRSNVTGFTRWTWEGKYIY